MQVSSEGRLLLYSVRKAATAYSKDDVPWTWYKWLQEHFFFLGHSDKQQFFQVSQIRILSNIYSDNPQIIMEAGFANFTV